MSSDYVAHEVAALDKTWHKIVSLVCKEGYASMPRIRRFIYLLRGCTECIENLQRCTENRPLIYGITDDIDDVVIAFEAVDRFIETHFALSEENLSLYQDLRGDIEDSLLRLLYLGEEVKLDDGLLLVICIPTP
jgi:hypothetical protein